MKIRNAIILTMVLFAVMGTIWYTLSDREAVTLGPVSCNVKVAADIGYCAPNFTLQDMEGNSVELYNNDGKPTIINFWASWCEPCKREMPLLQKAFDEHGDQIRFLLINQLAQDDLADVKKFLQGNTYTFPILLDEPNPDQKSVGLHKYNVFGLPMTYAMDAGGIITHRIAGEITEEQVQQMIKKLLD